MNAFCSDSGSFTYGSKDGESKKKENDKKLKKQQRENEKRFRETEKQRKKFNVSRSYDFILTQYRNFRL